MLGANGTGGHVDHRGIEQIHDRCGQHDGEAESSPVDSRAQTERVPRQAGAIEAVDENTCVLKTGGNSVEELAMYLRMIGHDISVNGPPELIEHLETLSRRYGRAIP